MGLFITIDSNQTVNGYGNATMTPEQDYLSRIPNSDTLEANGIHVGFLDGNHDGQVGDNENLTLYSYMNLKDEHNNDRIVFITFTPTSDGRLQVSNILGLDGGQVKLPAGVLQRFQSSSYAPAEVSGMMTNFVNAYQVSNILLNAAKSLVLSSALTWMDQLQKKN